MSHKWTGAEKWGTLIAGVALFIALLTLVSNHDFRVWAGWEKPTPPVKGTPNARANLDGSDGNSYRLNIVSAQLGQPIKVRILMRNTGSVDAIDVEGFYVVYTYPETVSTTDACNNLANRLKEAINSGAISEKVKVAAGQDYSVEAAGPALSLEDIKNIRLGNLSVYAAGSYSYADQNHANWKWRFRKIVKGSLGDCGGKQWVGW